MSLPKTPSVIVFALFLLMVTSLGGCIQEPEFPIEESTRLLGGKSGPYSFTLDERELLWFTLEETAIVQFETTSARWNDPVLRILDRDLEEIAMNNNNDNAKKRHSLIEMTLEPGEYYLELTGWNNGPLTEVYIWAGFYDSK